MNRSTLSLVVAIALISSFKASTVNAAVTRSAFVVPDAANIVYFFNSGDLVISSDILLGSVDIRLTGGLQFDTDTRPVPEEFRGIFDVFEPLQITKFEPNDGFARIRIDNILPAGLDDPFAEISVDGSLLAGGALSDAPAGGPFGVVVPEPSSLLALVCCSGVYAVRRRR